MKERAEHEIDRESLHMIPIVEIDGGEVVDCELTIEGHEPRDMPAGNASSAVSETESRERDFEDFDLQGFGPGLKYYLMPIDIFASGSLLVSRVSLQNGYAGDARVPLIISETSPWGVTGRVSAGKEWWISADWGLGIAAEFLLGWMSGSTPLPTASGVGEDRYMVKGFSLLASASFN